MIQIDMEMPKSCVDCFLMRHMHCSITCESIPLEKRLDNCPLHEVTADHDTVSRKQAIDAVKWGIIYADEINTNTGEVKELCKEGNDALKKAVERIKDLPSAQPETHEKRTETHACDCISRQAAIDALDKHLQTTDVPVSYPGIISALTEWLNEVPSAQQDSKETSPTHKALDTISRQAAIRWVKTECNPYGKPTLDFESGKKVIEHLKQMPSAQPEITECPMCPDCPDNCPLEVEHD